MEEALAPIRELVAGTIDFKGQQAAQYVTDQIVFIGVTLSVIAGLVTQNFGVTVWTAVVSYSVLLVACLPIPMYRKNPIAWRSPISSTNKGKATETTTIVS